MRIPITSDIFLVPKENGFGKHMDNKSIFETPAERFFLWDENGRGNVASLIYIKLSKIFYGYFHGYEGGGEYAEAYFRITHDDDGEFIQFLLADAPESEEFFSDLVGDLDDCEIARMSEEDRVAFSIIKNEKTSWLEFDEDHDALVIQASKREGEMIALEDGRAKAVSEGFSFDFGNMVAQYWPLKFSFEDEDEDEDRSE